MAVRRGVLLLAQRPGTRLLHVEHRSILPECNWLSDHKDPVVRGKLNSRTRGTRPTDSRLCSIPRKSRYPLHNRRDQHFEARVEEALRFLLAQSVSTCVLAQAGWLELSSGTPRSRRTAINPANRTRFPCFGRPVLETVILGYVIREAKHPYTQRSLRLTDMCPRSHPD